MRSTSLGLIMITLNEAANLGRSLAPVIGLFDEAVVVDAGSTDGTVQAARDLGATVVEAPWQGDFSLARNRSIDRATADYLFWLDGDNAVSPAGAAALRAAAAEAEPDEPIIGWCTEVLVPNGERLIQKRLFPRRPEVRFRGRIHEQLVHPAGYRFVHLDLEIEHWGYADPDQARQKGLRNLALLEAGLAGGDESFFLLYQAGATCFNLGLNERAEKYLARATAVDRVGVDNPELLSHAYALWGRLAERAGRPDQARRRYDLGLGRDLGDSGQGLLNHRLGVLAAGQGRWDEAIDRLTESRRLGLDFLTLALNRNRLAFSAASWLARAQAARGRLDLAAGEYRLAATLAPDNPDPLRRLIRLLMDHGRRAEADLVLDKLLRSFPDDRFGRRLKNDPS